MHVITVEMMLLSRATRKVLRRTETRTSHVLAPVISGAASAVAGLEASLLAVMLDSCDVLPGAAGGSDWAILADWRYFPSSGLVPQNSDVESEC